jgi:glycosyltransferase involved in cell wall biosynthesis
MYPRATSPASSQEFWIASMPADTPTRLTIVLTHPVQYFAPWFRHIHAHEPRIALTVLYATQPTPEQQGAGFGRAFEWDVPLLDGYHSVVLRPAKPTDSFSGDRMGVDAPDVGRAIDATSPDVVLVPGWHARFYRRAIRACRRSRIPVLYRGDSNLQTVHSGLSKTAWALQTQWRLARYDAYLSVGTRSREFLRELGAASDRVFDSPHAVDNRFFASAAAPHQTLEGRRVVRQRFGLADDEFVALFVGKLEEKKRPLDAVRAAAASSATLLVVGAGPLEAAVQEEASRAGARVRLAGFLNQSAIADAYAAADCLVLPSDRRETWGLVVNEAMATGLPCVVSSECGCAPDLIDDTTGATFRVGDVGELGRAIGVIAARLKSGHGYGDACRTRIAQFGFEQASEGLARACVAVHDALRQRAWPRVVVWSGHFVNPGGMERATFEVVRLIVSRGGAVHCLVNRWDSDKIKAMAESAGASWSTVYHHHPLVRRGLNLIKIAGMIGDVLITSGELLHAVRRRRATHVLIPDFVAIIRCAPALAWLRSRRVPVVLRIANAPAQTWLYRNLWRFLINPLTTRFVANSRFTVGEVKRTGIPARKIQLVYNTPPSRDRVPDTEPPPHADVVFVGQIIPQKGLVALLEAIALLRQDCPDMTLNIAGPMTGWVSPHYRGYRESLVARANAADLAGHVRFLGWREDVPAVLAAGSVHCCPSLYEQQEAFGNVVIEAKAAGLPSVVSPWGGLPELVAHRENGWICADVTPEAIAEGLRFFLGSPDRLRAASHAARASLGAFSRERFEQGWAQVFELEAAADRAVSAAPGGPAAAKGSIQDGHPLSRF